MVSIMDGGPSDKNAVPENVVPDVPG